MKILFLLCALFCASSLTGLSAQPTAKSASELFCLIYRERKAGVPFDFECTSYTTHRLHGRSTSFSVFDDTGAVILINHKSITNILLRTGERIRIKGRTRRYHFNQIVGMCNSIEHIGQTSSVPLPEPVSAEGAKGSELIDTALLIQ